MQINRWAVWHEKRPTILLVLILDGSAVVLALTGGIWPAATVPHMLLVSALGALSFGYSSVTRRSERLINALQQGRGPNLLGAFTFAGAVLLPRPAILVLVAVVYAADWPTRRSYGGKLFRHVSTAAIVTLGCFGASAIHQAVSGLAGIAAAILLFMAINVGLVAAAMVAAGQVRMLRMFLVLKPHLMETATQAVGAVMAAALAWHLTTALTVLPVIIGIQAGSIRDRVRLTEAVDPATNIWSEHGFAVLVAEAIAGRQRFAVFVISPDWGDAVDPLSIRAVIDNQQLNTDYSFGHFSGGQVVMLMPRMVDAAARLLARRFTAALAGAGIGVVIGTAAGYPDGPDQGDIMVSAFSAVVGRRASRSSEVQPR